MRDVKRAGSTDRESAPSTEGARQLSPAAREWRAELRSRILAQLGEAPRPLAALERRWPATRRHVELLVAELLEERLVGWRETPAAPGGRVLAVRQSGEAASDRAG